jgi:hypothetical protein
MKSEMKEISQRGTLVVIVPKVIWPTMMLSSQNPAIGINLDKKMVLSFPLQKMS